MREVPALRALLRAHAEVLHHHREQLRLRHPGRPYPVPLPRDLDRPHDGGGVVLHQLEAHRDVGVVAIHLLDDVGLVGADLHEDWLEQAVKVHWD